MLTTPTSGEDLTIDFGFVGSDSNLHDSASLKFMNGASLILSRFNIRLANILLNKDNQCSGLKKGKIKEMRKSSLELYRSVWGDIWLRLDSNIRGVCNNDVRNYVVKADIEEKIGKIDQMNKRLTRCLKKDNLKRGKRLRRKFRKQMKSLNEELRKVPDDVSCIG